jgi:hypothetical protein
MVEAMAITGAPDRCASYKPLMRCTWPGPLLPAQQAKAIQLCFGAGCVSANLFMAYMYPLYISLASYGIIYFVKAIAGNGIYSFYTGIGQHFYQLICNIFCHGQVDLCFS